MAKPKLKEYMVTGVSENYHHYFVMAESEEDARLKVEDGDFDSEEDWEYIGLTEVTKVELNA
jgi:hypothetical protein